jgi:hypothetical protein
MGHDHPHVQCVYGMILHQSCLPSRNLLTTETMAMNHIIPARDPKQCGGSKKDHVL